MAEIRGAMTRIGSREGEPIVNASNRSAIGNVRVAGKIRVIEIGGTTLRDVGCKHDCHDNTLIVLDAPSTGRSTGRCS